MRFILALASIVGVFFLARYFLGTTWAIGLSGAVLLVLWIISNYREGTLGLYRANIRTYFLVRAQGVSHQEAIERVVQSRFPFSREKRSAVLNEFEQTRETCEGDEGKEVKKLVHIIFCVEKGHPPTTTMNYKVISDIHRVYKTIAQKHKIPL